MVVATEKTRGLIVLTLCEVKGKVHKGPYIGSGSYLLTFDCQVQV